MAAVIQNSYFPHDLPWAINPEQQARFNKLLRWSVAAIIISSIFVFIFTITRTRRARKTRTRAFSKINSKGGSTSTTTT